MSPGTLYEVVEPCEVKSVTARELVATTAVPAAAPEAIVPDAEVVYVNVVVVGTVKIVYVPFSDTFADRRPATTTESPTSRCALSM